MTKSHLNSWSADRPILDQIQPDQPAILQPPIHFTHVLGPLLRNEKLSFDETKSCNNLFYDAKFGDVVTPLSYLFGNNAERVVYHQAIATLLYHPDLSLQPECDHDLFFYLVRFPTLETIKTINTLSAFRKNIFEDDLSQILKEFSKKDFKFDNEKCPRKLAIQAFAAMLNAPIKIDFKENAEDTTTPLLAALRIPTIDDEKTNPFVQLWLAEIKILVIKKLALEEIQTEKELAAVINRMAGNSSDQNYRHAITYLTLLVNDLMPYLKKQTIKSKDTNVLLSLIDHQARKQERKEYKAIKSAIDANDLPLAHHLIDIVNYDSSEFLINYILKKNDDELYGFIHAIFKSELGTRVTDKFIGRKLSKFHKTMPKIAHALLIELLSQSDLLVREFKDQHPDVIFATDPKIWQEEYQVFLKDFLEIQGLTEMHVRFINRYGMRHVIDESVLLKLNCSDLRDYAYFCFYSNKYKEVVAAIQQIERINAGLLTLEDLFLLARTKHFMHKNKEFSPINKIALLVDEVCCLLRCELISPDFIDFEEYTLTQDLMVEILSSQNFKRDENQSNDRQLRFLSEKLNNIGKLFIPYKHKITKNIYLFVMTLLEAIDKLTSKDIRAIAECRFNQALSEYENQSRRVDCYRLAIDNYLQLVKTEGNVMAQDSNNIHSAICQIIQFYQDKPILAVPCCDQMIQTLFSGIHHNQEEGKKLASKLADQQEKLCNVIHASVKEHKISKDLDALLAINTIHAWICKEEVNWKKVKILSEIHLSKLQNEQDKYRLLMSELHFYCGLAFRNLGDLEKGNQHFTAASALCPGPNMNKTIEFNYAHAECLYAMIEKNNSSEEIIRLLDKTYAYLKENHDDGYSMKIKKMTLLMKIYIKKIDINSIDPKQVEIFKKDLDTVASLHKDAELLSCYIEANIKMGFLINEADYFVDAINANPATKDMSDDKDLIIKFARAYLGYVNCDYKHYTNERMLKIISLLKKIEHPAKENILCQCENLFKHLSQVVELKQALQAQEAKQKAEAKTIISPIICVHTETQPKTVLRRRGVGEGAPIRDCTIDTTKAKKANPGPRNPERKKENDELTFNLRKKAKDRNDENARMKLSIQQRRDQRNLRAEQDEVKRKAEEAKLGSPQPCVIGMASRLKWFLEGGYQCPMRLFDSKETPGEKSPEQLLGLLR